MELCTCTCTGATYCGCAATNSWPAFSRRTGLSTPSSSPSSSLPSPFRLVPACSRYITSPCSQSPNNRHLLHCKKGSRFSRPQPGHQTLPGRELLNYSRPGRVWQVIFPLGTGKSLTFFYIVTLLCSLSLCSKKNVLLCTEEKRL